MVQRLTYRRRHCYATKSNKQRIVKTPGARVELLERVGRARTGEWRPRRPPAQS